MQRDLKIKAHVICSMCLDHATFYQHEGEDLFRVLVKDSYDANISAKLTLVCQFIDKFIEQDKAVLIFSDLGISRSVAVVIAYLVYHTGYTLTTAYEHVKDCRQTACPNQAFLQQLGTWYNQTSETFPYRRDPRMKLLNLYVAPSDSEVQSTNSENEKRRTEESVRMSSRYEYEDIEEADEQESVYDQGIKIERTEETESFHANEDDEEETEAFHANEDNEFDEEAEIDSVENN
jgi:hypothetical protein